LRLGVFALKIFCMDLAHSGKFHPPPGFFAILGRIDHGRFIF
jgi:hypothetical protein